MCKLLDSLFECNVIFMLLPFALSLLFSSSSVFVDFSVLSAVVMIWSLNLTCLHGGGASRINSSPK